MSSGEPVEGSIYVYAPNKAAAIFCTAAFAASGLFHLWQCIRYKSFKITALYPFSCLLFTVGFALRSYNTFDYDNINTYIASTCLIYMSPPIFELANYHVLGRILYYVPYFSPLHPGRVLTTFGILSSIVEVFNAIGITYVANSELPDKLNNLGDILLKVSLVIQILVISMLYVVAGIFHRRCIRGGITVRNVTIPLCTLYTSMLLILGRTIYRIVEHFSFSGIQAGSDRANLSPILRYEWFFYVFEALLMIVNCLLWNFQHPRRYLPEDYCVYLAQDGTTELQGSGWKDERSFLVTILDPFGMFIKSRESEKTPFWEINGFAGSHSNKDKRFERNFAAEEV